MTATPFPDTSIADLRNHPQFEAAAVASMRGAIELHRSASLAGWILNDRARALFGHSLIYLHASRVSGGAHAGLSAARVKEFAVRTGICSAGRAAAMLGLMRVAGYVTRAADMDDRRLRLLAPTAKLRGIQRERVGGQFEAMAAVLPEVAGVARRLDRDDFQDALSRALGEQFIAGARVLANSSDLVRFAERTAGMMVLFSLLMDAKFAVERPLAVSISLLAGRFRVSRTQVLRLLRQAEAVGYVRRTGDTYEGVAISARLKDDVLNMLAGMFLLLAGAASEALGTADGQSDRATSMRPDHATPPPSSAA